MRQVHLVLLELPEEWPAAAVVVEELLLVGDHSLVSAERRLAIALMQSAREYLLIWIEKHELQAVLPRAPYHLLAVI